MPLRFAISIFLIAARAAAQTGVDELMKTAESALSRGDYATAIQNGRAAAGLLEKSPNRARLGAAENVIGVAHLNKGEYAAARPYFERAVLLAQETRDIAGEVRRRNNLGNVYFYLGQYVKAYEIYQAAIARLAGSEKQIWYAGTRQLSLTNLAVLHQQLGQHQKALELYKEIRALPLQMKPGVEAQMLTNLAIVYRRLGDPQKALDTYRQARKLLEKDPNAAAALYTLHNVGVVLALDFADFGGALRTFTQAIAIASKSGSKREVVLERLFRGETLLLMGRPAEARADFATALAEARGMRLVDEVWTALYGLGRTQAAAGDRAGALESYRQAVDVIEAVRSNLGNASLKAEFLAGKRDVYDALVGELLDQPAPPVAEILQRIEEGRARSLKELLPAERQTVSLGAVQGALDGQTMALEYWLAGGRLAVVWITRDGAGIVQRRVARTEAGRLEELARALSERESTAWSGLADEISAMLFDASLPVAREGVRRLVIVPDGRLHALPFEVLRLPGGKRVIEQFEVSYLPSAHFLHSAARAADRHWPWTVTLAAFADPLPGKAGSATPFDAGWPRLAYSEEEARTIASALPGRERLMVGPNNLKHAVLGAGRVPVWHFATHGAVDTTDSRRSRLVFTPVEGDASSQYLFSNEISRLSMAGVELVTLAACESERGRYVRGEGVENLSRAFLGAGAGATVSSLWRVSDRASAQLMGRFYEVLAEGATKAEALRSAKLAMLEMHPYYWAPYILSGDGHTPLTPSVSWWPFAGGVGAAVGVLGFVMRRRVF